MYTLNIFYRYNKKDPVEFIELIEALAVNRSLTIENRHVIMHNFIKPRIFDNWHKYFRHNLVHLFNLMKACFELGYFHSKIIQHCIKAMIIKKRFSNLEKLMTVKNVLLAMQKNNLSEYPVDNLLEMVNYRLESKEDYKWRYNMEENRLYTYKEMKEKRENPKFLELEYEFVGIIPRYQRTREVWENQRIHLIMKRDHFKNMRKMREAEKKDKQFSFSYIKSDLVDPDSILKTKAAPSLKEQKDNFLTKEDIEESLKDFENIVDGNFDKFKNKKLVKDLYNKEQKRLEESQNREFHPLNIKEKERQREFKRFFGNA